MQLPGPLPMDRFRPNLVIAGGEAYQEDRWHDAHIGNALFRMAKPCARCAIATIDQRTGRKGAEPLHPLPRVRPEGNKVLFAQYASALSGQHVRVGGAVRIAQLAEA